MLNSSKSVFFNNYALIEGSVLNACTFVAVVLFNVFPPKTVKGAIQIIRVTFLHNCGPSCPVVTFFITSPAPPPWYWIFFLCYIVRPWVWFPEKTSPLGIFTHIFEWPILNDNIEFHLLPKNLRSNDFNFWRYSILRLNNQSIVQLWTLVSS